MTGMTDVASRHLTASTSGGSERSHWTQTDDPHGPDGKPAGGCTTNTCIAAPNLDQFRGAYEPAPTLTLGRSIRAASWWVTVSKMVAKGVVTRAEVGG
jgi:hypothetical protein